MLMFDKHLTDTYIYYHAKKVLMQIFFTKKYVDKYFLKKFYKNIFSFFKKNIFI